VRRIGTGSQVISAGLLLGASGTKRNFPVFKFGYVSTIPSEKIAVSCCPQCEAKPYTEWLIAASLVPGNSGSPIVYVPPGAPGIGLVGERAFLLGVQSISFIGSDVAGMAPIQVLLDTMRSKLDLKNADFSVGSPIKAPQQPTSVSAPAKPESTQLPK